MKHDWWILELLIFQVYTSLTFHFKKCIFIISSKSPLTQRKHQQLYSAVHYLFIYCFVVRFQLNIKSNQIEPLSSFDVILRT